MRNFNLTERAILVLAGLCANPNVISKNINNIDHTVKIAIAMTKHLEQKVKEIE